MSVEQLQSELAHKSRDELNLIAKKIKVRGYRRLTIPRLIEQILKADETSVRRVLKLTWWDKHRGAVFGWSSVIGIPLAILLFWVGLELSPVDSPEEQIQFEVHFQRADQKGSFQFLSANHLPLKSGDRIQLHARFPECMAAYVASLSSDGSIQILYPGVDVTAPLVEEIHIPTDQDRWLPLEPPGGTETLVLVASFEPLADRDQLRRELRAFGPAPKLSTTGLLLADSSGVRFVPTHNQRPLGTQPTRVEKGFISNLLARASERWPVVRVVSFPHQSNESSENTNAY